MSLSQLSSWDVTSTHFLPGAGSSAPGADAQPASRSNAAVTVVVATVLFLATRDPAFIGPPTVATLGPGRRSRKAIAADLTERLLRCSRPAGSIHRRRGCRRC